jgi:hypothetical protein
MPLRIYPMLVDMHGVRNSCDDDLTYGLYSLHKQGREEKRREGMLRALAACVHFP